LVNLPIGAAGLWLAWHYAKEMLRLAQREIDLPGQIAAIAALGALAGALIEGGTLGWSHPLVIVGFAAAAARAAPRTSLRHGEEIDDGQWVRLG
jgi:DHA2 family methylenomycin A resistance protein-like MFS transporter